MRVGRRQLLIVMACAASRAIAQSDCNATPRDPVIVVPVPGHPFQALPTANGCWVFVSMNAGPDRGKSGVAILRRSKGRLSLDRIIDLPAGPTGMALTRRDSLLVVAAGDDIAFIDVDQAIHGRRSAILGI